MGEIRATSNPNPNPNPHPNPNPNPDPNPNPSPDPHPIPNQVLSRLHSADEQLQQCLSLANVADMALAAPGGQLKSAIGGLFGSISLPELGQVARTRSPTLSLSRTLSPTRARARTLSLTLSPTLSLTPTPYPYPLPLPRRSPTSRAG